MSDEKKKEGVTITVLPVPGPRPFEGVGTKAADLTDMGNAERLVERHSNKLRFVASWDSWIVWDGSRWEKTAKNAGPVVEFAKETAKYILEETKRSLRAEKEKAAKAASEDSEDDTAPETARSAISKNGASRLKAAKRAQGRNALESMVKLASSDERIATHHDNLDRPRLKLNVANGTLNLQTGKLEPAHPEDLMTRRTRVKFNPKATCPKWETFLQQSTKGNQELVSFLQAVSGYCLTGQTTEEKLFVHVGEGRNGKSTYLDTMIYMLGEYASAAPRNILLKTRSSADRHPAEFTALYGLRFATCNELDEGAEWDEGRVKDLNSTDRIACRGMGENWWSFMPTHKLHVATNYYPKVRGDDEGIWRRLVVIPWNNEILEAQKDLGLKDALKGEIEGILNWALEGCLRWQKEGLVLPQSVLNTVAEYRQNNDIFAQFARDVLLNETEVRLKALSEAYEVYCKEARQCALGAQRFNARMKKIGWYQEVRTPTGKPSYRVWLRR